MPAGLLSPGPHLAVVLALATLAALAGGAVLVRPSPAPSGQGAPAQAAADLHPVEPVQLDMTIHVMQGPDWHVIDQNTAPGVLVLNVRTSRIEGAADIARDILERLEDSYDEVLMYFYRPELPGAPAAARVQWTPASGYRTQEYGVLP